MKSNIFLFKNQSSFKTQNTISLKTQNPNNLELSPALLNKLNKQKEYRYFVTQSNFPLTTLRSFLYYIPNGHFSVVQELYNKKGSEILSKRLSKRHAVSLKRYIISLFCTLLPPITKEDMLTLFCNIKKKNSRIVNNNFKIISEVGEKKKLVIVKSKKTEKNIEKLEVPALRVQNQKLFYLFSLSQLGKKIISYFIKQGKKQQAEKLIYNVFHSIYLLNKKEKKNQNKKILLSHSLLILKRTLIYLMPFYETRTYHMKGRTNSVVLPIYNKRRRIFLIFKAIKNFLKKQKGSYSKKLAETLYSTSKKEGPLYQLFLKNMQEQKKEYPKVHFRWTR